MPKDSKWFDNTPDEVSYQIVMYGPLGDEIQKVEIERKEYLTLKAYLGGMRGFCYPTQLAELQGEQEDIQQSAFTIDAARETLEKYPALVLAPEFPAELQQYLIPEKETLRT